MRFSEHYLAEANILTVVPTVTWNKFTNLFGGTPKKAVLANWMSELSELNRKAFKQLARKMSDINTYQRKIGKKKITIKDMYRGYLADIRGGALQDKFPNYDPKGTPNPEIPLFKFSNGAQVALFNLPTTDGNRIYAIGINSKAKRTFEQLFGMPFNTFLDVYDAGKKSDRPVSDPDIDDVVDDKKDNEPSLFGKKPSGDDTVIDEPETEEKPVAQKKTGKEKDYLVLTLDKQNYDNVEEEWDVKIPKEWKTAVKKTKYFNDWGKGNKYSIMKRGDVYLVNDDNDYLLIFSDKGTFNRSKGMGMLDIWYIPPEGGIAKTVLKNMTPEVHTFDIENMAEF